MCGVALAIATDAAGQPAPATPEAIAACTQFGHALDLASLSYSDFANAVALGEVNPDYSDPTVDVSNASGRTGLREAAATALSASQTPGLQPQVAAPMRSWSLDAMKLVMWMGLRADVNRFNDAATRLNDDTHSAQMACAEAGTRA